MRRVKRRVISSRHRERATAETRSRFRRELWDDIWRGLCMQVWQRLDDRDDNIWEAIKEVGLQLTSDFSEWGTGGALGLRSIVYDVVRDETRSKPWFLIDQHTDLIYRQTQVLLAYELGISLRRWAQQEARGGKRHGA